MKNIDWNKQIDFKIIEQSNNKKIIYDILTNYFSKYNILNVKYSDFWIFTISIYVDDIGEVRLNINTRYSQFEFCSIRFIDSNIFDVEKLRNIYELVEYAKNIKSIDFTNLIS